jgi:hypothetical protein
MRDAEKRRLMNEKRQVIKERFCTIMKEIVQQNISRHALLQGVSEAAIRAWITGASAPTSSHKLQISLEKIHVPVDVLHYTEEKWLEYYERLKGHAEEHILQNPTLDQPTWLHIPRDFLRIESSVGFDTTVIVMTSDADDDVELRDVRNVVRVNIERGVNYLYVISRDCRKREGLITFIQSIRTRGGTSSGAINIMVVPINSTDSEWSLFDYALLVTKSHFGPVKENIRRINVEDIHLGFEQLYRGNDVLSPDNRPATTERRLWIDAPIRRQNILLDLICRWSAGAEWI